LSYNVAVVAYNEFVSATRVKVSRNGQVSVPAVVRHRWGTTTVLVIDRGDYAIIRPVPEDPIESLLGTYAASGPTAEDVRDADRIADAVAEERKQAADR
jgi:bifunctional DNA-binding transcriptional regulator/antitoxin component of YhaV-PrlF toxin-antitoxin module